MRNTMKLHGLSVALASSLLLAAAPARAKSDFPVLVKNHLRLSYAPPCSVCHAKGNTGSGTVTTPFGWSMRAQGLTADNGQSVGKALDALASAKTDSDGDGVDDIDELVASDDPNSPGPVALANEEQPGYGCGGKAPDPNRRGEGSVPWPAALLIAWGLRRMRRSR
jgi:hypothetical protein